MRPSLLPRLVNGPFDDPALFIQLSFQNRAILFDLGELFSLSTRDILKLTHVFVTHTHMDHFVGFDRLLRLMLGRDKDVTLYGPEGFMANVEGKLAGYQWNLVQSYTNRFKLKVVEVRSDMMLKKTYACHRRFVSTEPAALQPASALLLKEAAFQVRAAVLDHRIPCLGFSIQEAFHINIRKDALLHLGLPTGPWLNRFKQALFHRLPPDTEFSVPLPDEVKRFPLGRLAEEIAVISPGQKITYIADVVYSQENAAKIVELAQDSDFLFLEAAFLDKHADIAAQKHHLTARQAGRLAARARARRFTPFHFSPRYTETPEALTQEALQAYQAG